MRTLLVVGLILCVGLVCLLGVAVVAFHLVAPTRTEVLAPSTEWVGIEPFPNKVVAVTGQSHVVGNRLGVGVLAIGAMGLIFLVFLIGVAAFALRGSKCRRESYERTDKEFQELFHGFEELTKRIESLETILLERSGGKG